MKFHLGLFGLSGLFVGLGLKPKGSQIRVGHGLALGLVHGLAPDPVPDPGTDLGSDPVGDKGFLSVSSLDLTSEVPSPLGDESLGSDGALGSDGSLGAATVTGELPVPSLQMLSIDTIVDFCLTKSQKWLLASLQEAFQDDVVHLALVKDM